MNKIWEQAFSYKGYLTRIKSGREQLIHPSEKSKGVADQLERQGQHLYEQIDE